VEKKIKERLEKWRAPGLEVPKSKSKVRSLVLVKAPCGKEMQDTIREAKRALREQVRGRLAVGARTGGGLGPGARPAGGATTLAKGAAGAVVCVLAGGVWTFGRC